MKAAFCDVCGKAVDKWIFVKVYAKTYGDIDMEILNMTKGTAEYDICKDCFLEFLSTRNKMKERSSGK